jgi:hypothetical protein
MSNLQENAILLLRYMLEESLIPPKGISPEELQAAVGMNHEDFDNADNLILQGHFVEGTAGDRWLTSYGVQYVTEEIRRRIPTSLDAERILKFLIQEIGDNEFLTQDEILKGVNISPEKYRQACQQLADFDLVTRIPGSEEVPALNPTKQGRQTIYSNFQKSAIAPSIQAGAIFTGPVTGGNILAIASAMDSEIQQNVSSLSSEELHKEIEQILEKLLGQVSEHLSIEQKAAYTQLAADFQRETGQSKPDSGKLRKLLAALGFFSDLGGAIDLGHKAIQLVVIASPYILLLGQYIMQLLKN